MGLARWEGMPSAAVSARAPSGNGSGLERIWREGWVVTDAIFARKRKTSWPNMLIEKDTALLG
jgi:hypothetical protein